MIPYNGKATYRSNIMGWECNNCSRFHYEDERMARYCCHTHLDCDDCGKSFRKTGRIVCDPCEKKRDLAKWDAREKYPWPNNLSINPVVFDGDTFFFDEESAIEWIHMQEQDNDVFELSEIQLEICEAAPPPTLDLADLFSDVLPEDCEFDKDGAASYDINSIIEKTWVPVYRSSGKAIDWRTIPMGG